MRSTRLAILILLSAAQLCAGETPGDVRLQPPKDLNAYFPFTPPKSKAEWETRAEYVRRQILVSQGLWPMPTKNPLNAVVHGKIEKSEYSVEKVYFESAPGLFVTGNLYKPAVIKGKVPAVLFAHGHWTDARLSEENENFLRNEIATGQERFEQGGRSRFQSMCVQLARMGCIVFQYDMLSDSDSIQFSKNLVHGFSKQRPEMNTTENWGFYSAQADAHLQTIMGMHTLNSIRAMDFLLGMPEVDPERTAITGASGGGTQTMLLAAVDSRVKLSFPAVMVSTGMQGGCTCENAPLLRVNTGNVEFAGLFAPKPQGMTTANDWTKEMSTKGFPELKQLYSLLGASSNVMLQRGEHFPHNYNAVSRVAFYTWLNRHFKLGFKEPVIEKDYEPLKRADLTVWDAQHPAPKAADPDSERSILKWFTQDAEKQLRASATTLDGLKKDVAPAVEVLIGRTYAAAGECEWKLKDKEDRDTYIWMTGTISNKTYSEEVFTSWLYPKTWNGSVVVWLNSMGANALTEKGDLARVMPLVKSGTAVIAANLLAHGEYISEDGEQLKLTRTVANPRESAAYTLGYNSAYFAQRTHDVLTIVSFLRNTKVADHPHPETVDVCGFGDAGPVVAAARALAGDAINRGVIDTNGFRFSKLLNARDPQFLPGGAKYLDLPGMLALGAPGKLWLAGEGAQPELVSGIYKAAGKSEQLTTFTGDGEKKTASAVEWLSK